jgi:hypothetical protein
MKNQTVQFEITDYRKSKSQAQWVTIYISRIKPEKRRFVLIQQEYERYNILIFVEP